MRVKSIKENSDYSLSFSVYKLEPSFVVLSAMALNQFLDSEFRMLARYVLFKLSSKFSFPNNFLNRCLLTGRVRSTIPFFKLSRIEFSRLSKQSLIFGVSKSSWLFFFY